MNENHLTDDELIDRVYGVGSFSTHLAGCPECAARLRVFERRRAASAEAVPVSSAVLAAQRHRILERVEQQPSWWRMHWVPAVLAGGLAAVAVLVPYWGSHGTPVRQKAAVQQEVSEDKLVEDVFSLEAAEEPRAASAIRGLFEEGTERQ